MGYPTLGTAQEPAYTSETKEEVLQGMAYEARLVSSQLIKELEGIKANYPELFKINKDLGFALYHAQEIDSVLADYED